MKKELCAAGLLLALLLSAFGNFFYLSALSDRIGRHLDSSAAALQAEDTDTARMEMHLALKIWLSADGYTHVFLRHSEIDSTSDAFYDVLECLQSPDTDGTAAAMEKLRYHLDSIVSMERPTLRSIF